MNGRRAREARREQARMPPELRAEMKERLRAVAVALSDRLGEARRKRDEKVGSARDGYSRLARAAYAEHDQRRAAIREEFERRAGLGAG